VSGVYCCPYCLKATGTPELLDGLPDEYLCTCFPLHGQWMPVMINGECVGTILLDSSHFQKGPEPEIEVIDETPNAVAPQS
jgi:hypothetical protein